ncbi:MAG: hypothetical protein ACKVS8_11295 [Phycisphaerales bacterium]
MATSHPIRLSLLIVASLACALALPAAAEPAPQTFTYRALVNDGTAPANGAYDVQARLFNALAGGTQVGSMFQALGVNIANGQLLTPMSFGSPTLYNGQRLWVELSLRAAGSPTYTTLSPRQEMTAVPYALGLVAPMVLSSEEYFPLSATSTSTLPGASGIESKGAFGLTAISTADAETEPVGRGVYAHGGAHGLYGVQGNTLATGSFGVYGLSSGSGGTGVSGVGQSGVKGSASGGGADFGGYFFASGVNSNGVKGECNNGGAAYGVWGASTTGFAGYFDGRVQVVGNLSKSGGSFKIDHPLDPANKYLSHSFVESPDMMNIYNGTVTTDAKGYATVALPDWFTALNKDYRYQLTVIDERDSADFVQAKVVRGVAVKPREGAATSFTLRTSRPSTVVSWQITGIRQDAWANAHRIQTEELKAGTEAGRYLHPELFGQSEAMRTGAGKAAAVAADPK